MTNDFFANINLSEKTASSYSLPNILIGAANQLIQLNYNPQTQKYQPQVTVNLWESDSHPAINPNFIQVLSDEIIVGTQAKIVKLSRSLEKIKVREFAEIAAIAIAGETIFVGTEGKLVSLDKDLKILSEVDLELPGFRGKKNTHDILVYGSVAYLLDNIIEPIYILRVDVSNPSHLQIISKFEIVGTNHHLKRQWLNPSLNQWYILQSYGTQAGSGENIIIFSLDLETGGVSLERSQFAGFRSPFEQNSSMLGYQAINRTSFSEPREFQGIELLTANPFPPLWAVIHDQREQLYLALMNSRNNQIVFDKQLHLGKLTNGFDLTAQIMSINQLLLLVIKGWNNNHLFARLLLIKLAKRPSIILNQALDEVALESLTVAHCLNGVAQTKR